MPKNPTLKERLTKVETKVEHIEDKVDELNDGQHAIIEKMDVCEANINGIDIKLTKFIAEYSARARERESIVKQAKTRIEIVGGVLGIILAIITLILLFAPK